MKRTTLSLGPETGGASGRVSTAAAGGGAATLFRICQAKRLSPRAAARSTAKAMMRCRGIIVSTSWSVSQLVAHSGDCCGDRAGDELLVIGGSQLRKIGSLRCNLDREGWSGQVVQGPECR